MKLNYFRHPGIFSASLSCFWCIISSGLCIDACDDPCDDPPEKPADAWAEPWEEPALEAPLSFAKTLNSPERRFFIKADESEPLFWHLLQQQLLSCWFKGKRTKIKEKRIIKWIFALLLILEMSFQELDFC